MADMFARAFQSELLLGGAYLLLASGFLRFTKFLTKLPQAEFDPFR